MSFSTVGVILLHEFATFSGSNIIFPPDWGSEAVHCVSDFSVVLAGRFLLHFWFYVRSVTNFHVHFSFFEVW